MLLREHHKEGTAVRTPHEESEGQDSRVLFVNDNNMGANCDAGRKQKLEEGDEMQTIKIAVD